jgi:hypothetical protein
MICCQDFMARGAAVNPTRGCDRAPNSIAAGGLSFLSFLGFRGGAISEVGVSTEVSPEIHSLWFALPRPIVPLMPAPFFGPVSYW